MSGTSRLLAAMMALGAAGCASSPAAETAPAVTPAALPAEPTGRLDATPVRGAFVVRLGTDTVAIEQFVRAGNVVEGDIVSRPGGVRVTHYRISLEPDKGIRTVETEIRSGSPTPGAAPFLTQTLTRVGDSLTLVQRRGDTARTTAVPASARALAHVPYSFIAHELLVAGRAAGDAGATMLSIGSRTPWTGRVEALGPDSVQIVTPNGIVRAKLDPSGGIAGLRTVGGTFQLSAERVQIEDFPAAVARMAQEEVARGPIRQLSPPDSVRARVGGVSLDVDYHRPAKRGRVIFGGLVPWDSVWRTGANQATVLRTGGDLMFGSTLLPAGSYTIWTVPSRSGWTLILNHQTGQWGTIYNAERDFARIPMETRPVSPPVERFTIGVERDRQQPRLTLTWDDMQASVPVRVP